MAYLRHKPTGDVYIATAPLLERTDMEEMSDTEVAKHFGVEEAPEKEAPAKPRARNKRAAKPKDTATNSLADDILSAAEND